MADLQRLQTPHEFYTKWLFVEMGKTLKTRIVSCIFDSSQHIIGLNFVITESRSEYESWL